MIMENEFLQTEEHIVKMLKTVFDPEIPVNIYELGLIYKIDVEKLTKDPYISVNDIYQTGKLFLGEGECKGLLVTDDGGFVTYDASNNTLKHVVPNR